MAALLKDAAPTARPSGWLDQLELLLTRELAPTREKFRTAFRLTTIATIGAALVVICHVNSELGTYIVWLLVGAGPMLSVRKAGVILFVEGLVLTASVVLARAFAETPWLMLPFLFALAAVSTYVGITHKLGAAILLMQVVSLDIFYSVVFAPQAIGWGAAGAFGGTTIAFGVIVLFDNWLWPDPGDPILMKSLGSSIGHEASRLIEASKYYLGDPVSRPRVPPPTSDLPGQLALLDRVVAEGATAHRRAVLVAAITRVARVHLEVDRLIVAAREGVSREIRAMLRPELQAAVDAIAAALEQIADETPTLIRVGADSPPPASRTQARSQMDALSARVVEVRPTFIRRVGTAEVGDFAAFTDCLAALTTLIERLLDEPPAGSAIAATRPATQSTEASNTPLVRYCQKVGLCVVIGYLVGILAHRVDLSTILTTVLITALPTYGASIRKMILRIVGAVLGGLVSLAAIMIVTPNFETLPTYLLATFIVLYVSAYASLTSGRVAYAGKQLGTTFVLVFSGLSPAVDIYSPLWRIWGILLGTFIVTIVFFLLWPAYAGDSLLPRLRKVIRETLDLAPGGSASHAETAIQIANAETIQVLAEILEVADDAGFEGRTSMINQDSVIQAAGNLRRIANRLSSIAIANVMTTTRPQLDEAAEFARAAVLAAIRVRLQSWLDFFDGDQSLSFAAAQSLAASHSREAIARPLEDYSARLEAGGFARIESWTLEARRVLLAELQSLRRLDFLMSELDRQLAQIPGAASPPPTSMIRAGRVA